MKSDAFHGGVVVQYFFSGPSTTFSCCFGSFFQFILSDVLQASPALTTRSSLWSNAAFSAANLDVDRRLLEAAAIFGSCLPSGAVSF
jgi:hypothetical protein